VEAQGQSNTSSPGRDAVPGAKNGDSRQPSPSAGGDGPSFDAKELPKAHKKRAYQVAVILAAMGKQIPVKIDGKPILQSGETLRSFFLLWRRQGGKSTLFSELALLEMLTNPGRLVTYASASLLMGREIIAKESQIIYRTIAEQAARANGPKIEAVNGQTGKPLPANIDSDAIAEIFEARKLEFKIHHGPGRISRTQVIAPNAATARGWSGTVLLDEFGFIVDFSDLWEAVEPIISSDRTFRLIGATTPPKDDGHFSYELTMPEVGAEFPRNPAGNWYVSQLGELIHRVDAYDAEAAGVKIFDRRTGREVSIDEHRLAAIDKDAWWRNYGIKHISGGTSAVGLAELTTAQQRGMNTCRTFQVEGDDDITTACDWLMVNLGDGKVGCGFDVATTENEQSNPSAFAVLEAQGKDNWSARAVLCWKVKDGETALKWITRLLVAISQRRAGGRCRRLAIDNSNEKYFARLAQKTLTKYCPVELIAGGESCPLAFEEAMNWKQYLGNVLVDELEMNRGTLPPELYIKDDFRRVKRNKGTFTTDTGPDGQHGDTFDAVKLGHRALRSQSSEAAFQSPGFTTGNATGNLAARRDPTTRTPARAVLV
jgi:hypothetical protein